MKKRYIIIIIIIVLCIILGTFIIYNQSNKKNKIDYDFSYYGENVMFYSDLSESTTQNEQKSLKNKVHIKVIDTNYNPIANAEISIYDSEKDVIKELKTNEFGEVGISNLKYDTTYYVKQTKATEGLVADETTYKMTLEYNKNAFNIVIVNDIKELTDEEEQKIKEEYEKQLKEDDKDYINLSSEEFTKNDNSPFEDKVEYSFLKEEFLGEKMYVFLNRTYDKIEKEYTITKAELRITNAFIKKFTVEKLHDTKNLVEIVDESKNAKTEFYNGEPFYVKINNSDYVGDIFFKVKMEVEYNGKTYCISKIIEENFQNKSFVGKIKLNVYKKGTKEKLDSDVKYYLEKKYENPDDMKILGNGYVSSEAKFYMVPKGIYRIYLKDNDKEIYSEFFEVKENELTDVEMEF